MTNQSNQAALFNTNKLLHQDTAPPQGGTAQKVLPIEYMLYVKCIFYIGNICNVHIGLIR